MEKGDVLIIITLLIVIVTSKVIIGVSNTKIDEKDIVIQFDNKIVKKISIDNNSKGRYAFNFNENIGYIEVDDGKVRMLEMDNLICPQKICSKTGWVEKKFETIACLPNKISASIKEINKAIDEKTEEVDGVSF